MMCGDRKLFPEDAGVKSSVKEASFMRKHVSVVGEFCCLHGNNVVICFIRILESVFRHFSSFKTLCVHDALEIRFVSLS